jgi:uncharacterized protein (DUF1330 family)
MTLVQIVRIPAEGIAQFQAFEAQVLPIMSRYGGSLERRLRSMDGRIEIHIVSFPSRDALDRYTNDADRTQHLPLRDASGASSELIEVVDVPAEI